MTFFLKSAIAKALAPCASQVPMSQDQAEDQAEPLQLPHELLGGQHATTTTRSTRKKRQSTIGSEYMQVVVRHAIPEDQLLPRITQGIVSSYGEELDHKCDAILSILLQVHDHRTSTSSCQNTSKKRVIPSIEAAKYALHVSSANASF